MDSRRLPARSFQAVADDKERIMITEWANYISTSTLSNHGLVWTLVSIEFTVDFDQVVNRITEGVYQLLPSRKIYKELDNGHTREA